MNSVMCESYPKGEIFQGALNWEGPALWGLRAINGYGYVIINSHQSQLPVTEHVRCAKTYVLVCVLFLHLWRPTSLILNVLLLLSVLG